MIEWHKKTFPNATLESQLLKVESELREVRENPSLEEWADVFISSKALYMRFGSEIGFLVNDIVKLTIPDIDKAVEEKMKKNRERSWVGDHHVH